MESTGIPTRIQISQQTADLLIGAGKESWIVPREGTVFAKGKGNMQTYWLTMTDDFMSEDGVLLEAHEKQGTTSSSSLPYLLPDNSNVREKYYAESFADFM